MSAPYFFAGHMKKQAKGRKASVKASAPGRGAKAANLDEVRRKIALRVANQAPKMVDAAINEVMKGEHQPMKYLFEMIGLYPEREVEKGGQDALAETLLRRLHFPEDSLKESEVEEEEEASQ